MKAKRKQTTKKPTKKQAIKKQTTKKTRYKLFQENIKEQSWNIDFPLIANKNILADKINLNTNLDSNIKCFNTDIVRNHLKYNSKNLKNDAIKTIKYKLLPTKEQENIFKKWFSAYIEMYNLIIKKIKIAFRALLLIDPKAKLTDLKIELNISKLKKEFSVNKENLQTKYDINMHILDYAMTDAIAMYKSKITNLRKGHIKKSRLRYLKQTKKTKIFKVENMLCQDYSFCSTKLGKFIQTNPTINFKQDTEIVGIVQYNETTNEYRYLARKRIFVETIKNKIYPKSEAKNIDNEKIYKMKQSKNENVISLDPGIRTFMTGISNKNIIEIGTNMSKTIQTKISRLDKIINNPDIHSQKKDKLAKRIRLKIKNIVDDYHWKIIKYLVDNYGHILIGNFSTKKMGQSDQQKIIKRIGSSMRFYTFKMRLQYKCYLSGTKYMEIDEYCTSKCCSCCGNFKKDLGKNKIYECKKCDLVLDRDINASINILMKGIK